MEHFRVNWLDGMRIDKNHFIDSENFLLSQQYLSNLLQVFPNRYGILLSPFDKKHKPDSHPVILFNIERSSRGAYSVIINDLRFTALSPEGTLIYVSMDSFSKETGKSSIRVDVSEEQVQHADFIYLVLLFRPFETVEFGEIDAASSELPLRTPYCRTLCSIQPVVSRADAASKYSSIVGANHFPVGRLAVNNKELSVDENYIPPVCNFYSHARLHTAMNQAIGDLSAIETSTIETLKELNSASGLVDFTRNLLQQLNIMVTQTKTQIEHFGLSYSPYKYVVEIQALSRIFMNMLSSDLRNSDALKSQWSKSNIRIHEFEMMIKSDLSKYEHFDIYPSLKICRQLLNKFFGEIARKEKYFGLLNEPRAPERPVRPAPAGEDIPEF